MSTAKLIETGPWAGWKTWPQDTWETGSGPFYCRRDNGRVVARFVAEPRHMNGGGFMHGGCLLTFADYACFAFADDVTGGSPSVTVNLSGDFLAPAKVGDMMEATGEVTRAGKRLIYVRGMVTANGNPCLSFTSVIAKVNRKS